VHSALQRQIEIAQERNTSAGGTTTVPELARMCAPGDGFSPG
jgi:hypothetical protein